MAEVDYIGWIKGALKRKPHLSQAGLARHLGRDKAVATALLNGTRAIKASEIDKIAAYLGESPPGRGAPPSPMAQVVGVIGPAWYEPGQAPKPNRMVSPSLDHPTKRQVAYIIETEVMLYPPGSIVIATPVDRSTVAPNANAILVTKRERSGLENITLSRARESKDAVEAIALEIRIPVYVA